MMHNYITHNDIIKYNMVKCPPLQYAEQFYSRSFIFLYCTAHLTETFVDPYADPGKRGAFPTWQFISDHLSASFEEKGVSLYYDDILVRFFSYKKEAIACYFETDVLLRLLVNIRADYNKMAISGKIWYDCLGEHTFYYAHD